MNFSIDCIKKIIVHKLIYLKHQKKFEVICSENLIENLSELKPQIRDKIAQLLSKSMAMNIHLKGDIFLMAKEIPKMKSKPFIEASITAAKKLAIDQESANAKKDSVLIVMHAENDDNQDIVFFVKSEFETGIEAKLESTADNITLTLLNNIIFTHTNYYKIGAFLCKEDGEWASALYDNLAKEYAKEKAVKYFYDAFLELSFRIEDNDLVKKFYDNTKKFIEENYSDIELFDKMTHLSSYLKAPNKPHVNTIEFGQEYLLENIHNYTDLMDKIEFPEKSISKNPEMVETYLKHRIIHFQNGININIPDDKFEENFILLNPKDIETEVLNKEEWTFIAIKGPIIPKK